MPAAASVTESAVVVTPLADGHGQLGARRDIDRRGHAATRAADAGVTEMPATAADGIDGHRGDSGRYAEEFGVPAIFEGLVSDLAGGEDHRSVARRRAAAEDVVAHAGAVDVGQPTPTAVAAAVQVPSAAELAALARAITTATAATGATGRVRRRASARSARFTVRGVQAAAAGFGPGTVAADRTGLGRVAAIAALAAASTVAFM
ncbi:hypothetical protein FEK35_18800 [Nocardia cyriacigeorgica]|uniref:Uncharacterized protein n=1 Tax=Nocardia cyriacigeorgica TaxID=135487 RepID=A0A5R8PAT2_9NOCA|nr:hypothetical protein FEK35_18800 [Nocardia cyriacigeorgica]